MKKDNKILIRFIFLIIMTLTCFFITKLSVTHADSEITKPEIKSNSYIINTTEKLISNVKTNISLKDFLNELEFTSNNYKVIDSSKHELSASDIIASGNQLMINNNTYTIVVNGDTSGDGNSNISDILEINKHRLNKIKLSRHFFVAGDVNYNNSLDLLDILQINKYRLKRLNSLVKPNIRGSVKIIGENECGKTLKVEISELTPSDATLSYQWYYSDSINSTVFNKIDNATSNEFTIKESLAGKYIYVIATAEKNGYVKAEMIATVNGVTSRKISPPVAANKTYNGTTQTAFNQSDGYTVTGNTGKDAKSYVGKAILKDKVNTTWIDGTTEDKTINWSIAKKEISVTWGSTVRWVYDGNNHVPTVTTPINGVNNEKINLTVSGAQKEIGVYTATANISSVTGGQQKADNYKISDSTKSITFSIAEPPAPKKITPPIATNKTYTGTTQTSFTQGEGYTVQNNTGINAGNYVGKAILNDKLHTTWADGTIGDKTLNWSIAAKTITITWGSTTSWNYDGKAHGPTVSTPVTGVNNEKINLSVSGTATNIGNYTATASISSVTGGQMKKENYIIANQSKSYSILKISVSGVTLNKTSIADLKIGSTQTLTATVSPSNATNKEITWTSSNSSIVKVSNGKLTALLPGTATITVKSKDGNKTATCKVTVTRLTRTFLANSSITTSSIFTKRLPEIASGYKQTQGFCSDGTYFYISVLTNYDNANYTDQKSILIKTDLKGNIKSKMSLGKIGHCNSLAYDSYHKKILIAPCSNAYKCLYTVPANFTSSTTVSKVTPKNKDGTNFLKVNNSYRTIGSAAFDPVTNQYILKTSVTSIAVFDKDFKYVKTVKLSSSLKDNDSYTGQAISCDGRYLYGAYTNSGYSYISIFNLDTGKLVGRRSLGKVVSSGTFELEEVTVTGNTFYISGNYRRSGHSNRVAVYKLKITK